VICIVGSCFMKSDGGPGPNDEFTLGYDQASLCAQQLLMSFDTASYISALVQKYCAIEHIEGNLDRLCERLR
jgi:hypothetical protein